MTDLTKNFVPESITGELVVTATDGRTMTLTVHGLELDQRCIDSVIFNIDHTPQYETTLVARKCVGNPITGIGVDLKVSANQKVDPLFTMVYRVAEEAS